MADVTTNATDHAAFPSGVLTFAGTAGETQTITVVVNGDTTIEANETFTATLGTVIGTTATQSAAITTGAVGTGTIINDDNSVSVAVSPSSVLEDGSTNLIYTFTGTGSTASALTVNFTVAGSAHFGGVGADYTESGADSFSASSGTITIGVGSTARHR